MTKKQKIAELIRMAEEEGFSPLNDPEREIFTAAVEGREAKCGKANTSVPNWSELFDAKNQTRLQQHVDKMPTIRSGLLRWLCITAEARSLVDPFGIQVSGAKFDEFINLAFCDLSFPLALFGCLIQNGVDLMYAKLRFLNLSGSYVSGLRADGVIVRSDIYLRNGFYSRGEVHLLGAKIGGNLECDDGRFENPGWDALSADQATIGGSVYLRNGFYSQGGVCFPRAKIGKDLDCADGRFENPSGRALSADGATIGGTVFLWKGFFSRGEVRLPGVKIGGNFYCMGGRFENPSNEPGVYALGCEEMFLRGIGFFNRCFSIDGRLGFINAYVGTLMDDPESWPKEGLLDLDGFVYDRLAPGAVTEAKKRLEWLSRMPKLDPTSETPKRVFYPQPYTQLAAVLQREGHTQNAVKILIAREDMRRKMRRWWGLGNLWGFLNKYVLGYGYKPARSLAWALLFIVLGAFVFQWANHQGLFVPVDQQALIAFDQQQALPKNCPPFLAFVYSLEAFIPVLHLGQDSAWCVGNLPSAWFFRVYLFIHRCLGWFVTILAVAGFTGLVKRKE